MGPSCGPKAETGAALLWVGVPVPILHPTSFLRTLPPPGQSEIPSLTQPLPRSVPAPSGPKLQEAGPPRLLCHLQVDSTVLKVKSVRARRLLQDMGTDLSLTCAILLFPLSPDENRSESQLRGWRDWQSRGGFCHQPPDSTPNMLATAASRDPSGQTEGPSETQTVEN